MDELNTALPAISGQGGHISGDSRTGGRSRGQEREAEGRDGLCEEMSFLSITEISN
jgi:hypothetical protein